MGLTVSSIALWAPAPGGDMARAGARDEELRTHLEDVKRKVADIDAILGRGGIQLDAAVRDRAVQMLSEQAKDLAEIRRLLYWGRLPRRLLLSYPPRNPARGARGQRRPGLFVSLPIYLFRRSSGTGRDWRSSPIGPARPAPVERAVSRAAVGLSLFSDAWWARAR